MLVHLDTIWVRGSKS